MNEKTDCMLAARRRACSAARRPRAQDAAQYRLHRTIPSASNTFWQAVKKGFDDACGKIQANCQMIFTQTEGSIEQQVANMQAALAAKPDALITSIVDNNAFDDVIKERARRRASSSSPPMSTTPKAPRAMPARPSSARASCRPAIRSAKAQSENFPKDGPIQVLVGVSAPGQNWSEQRGAGVIKFLEEYKAANPDRDVYVGAHRYRHRPRHHRRDRVGAYLNAHPDTTAYFDTGFWHAGVARVLADRGVAPARCCSAASTWCPRCCSR